MTNGKKLDKFIDYSKSWKISLDRQKSTILENITSNLDFLYILEIKTNDRTKIGFISDINPKLLTRTFSNKETVYSLDSLDNESRIMDIFPICKKEPEERIFNQINSPFAFILRDESLILFERHNYFTIDTLDRSSILNVELINGLLVFDYLNYTNLMISNLNPEDLVFLYRHLKYNSF